MAGYKRPDTTATTQSLSSWKQPYGFWIYFNFRLIVQIFIKYVTLTKRYHQNVISVLNGRGAATAIVFSHILFCAYYTRRD